MGRVHLPQSQPLHSGCAKASTTIRGTAASASSIRSPKMSRHARRRDLVMREGDLFRDNLARAPAGLGGFYEAIETRSTVSPFRRRCRSGQRVEGSMTPREGRFVLHGNLASRPGNAWRANSGGSRRRRETAANEALDARAMSADQHGRWCPVAIAGSGEVETARLVWTAPPSGRIERGGARRRDRRSGGGARVRSATGRPRRSFRSMLGGPLPSVEKPIAVALRERLA